MCYFSTFTSMYEVKYPPWMRVANIFTPVQIHHKMTDTHSSSFTYFNKKYNVHILTPSDHHHITWAISHLSFIALLELCTGQIPYIPSLSPQYYCASDLLFIIGKGMHLLISDCLSRERIVMVCELLCISIATHDGSTNKEIWLVDNKTASFRLPYTQVKFYCPKVKFHHLCEQQLVLGARGHGLEVCVERRERRAIRS